MRQILILLAKNACLKASLCIVFLAISSPVFANDSKSLFGLTLPTSDKNNSLFEGAYIGLGLNLEKNIIKKIEYDAAFPIAGVPAINGENNGGSSPFGVSGSLHGGYNFAINPKILLGVGVEFSTYSRSKADLTTDLYLAGSPPVLLGTTETTHTLKNRYNVFISPGYVISKDKLIYSKIGFSYMDSDLFSGEPPSIKNHHQGYLAGLGYKQVFFKDTLYGFGEMNYHYYPSLKGETFALDATNYATIRSSYDSLIVNFGIGYLF